ncbi:MFS transporter [Angustibacter aerolatus]
MGRARWAVPALALGGVALGTGEFASMGVLPSVAAAFGVGDPAAGRLVSAYAVGVVLGAPALAVLGARVPRRRLLLVAMGLVAAANVASALAPSLAWLTAARFVAGLPHGAYLGVAALAAASLVAPERRGRAIASIIVGLTVANVVGVPLAAAVGQVVGWRATFVLVALLAAVAVAAVRLAVPRLPRGRADGVLGELQALRHRGFWLVVAVCVVGVGGVFAVYTYVVSTLTVVAGVPRAWVPAVLALFGVGMTAGAVLGGRLADRSVRWSIALGMVGLAAVMVALTVLVRHPASAAVGVLLLGAASMAPMPSIQARLLDVAPAAPTLAAAMLHSATNTANAVGAWAGGLVLSAGAGYAAIGWVGAAMAVAGLLLSLCMFGHDGSRRNT